MLRPLGDKVLVRRDEAEKETSGGILLPDSASEKPKRGTVLAAGPGKKDENGNLLPMQTSIGDRVLFHRYGGAEVVLDGQEFLILPESEILCVLEEVCAGEKNMNASKENAQRALEE